MSERPKDNPYPGHHDGTTWYCGCKEGKEVALYEKIAMDDDKVEERSACRHWECGFRVWKTNDHNAIRASKDKCPYEGFEPPPTAQTHVGRDNFGHASIDGRYNHIGNVYNISFRNLQEITRPIEPLGQTMMEWETLYGISTEYLPDNINPPSPTFWSRPIHRPNFLRPR